jgi:KDO2-lipid IV(A) lauroyltransferase
LLVYWLFRLTILVIRPLPLALGYRIAAAVSTICYFFFRRQRQALNDNLSWVLQSNDRRAVDRVARRAFRNFGKFVVDFIRFPVIQRAEVRRRLVFQQWVQLDEVMASKRGVLITTMHYGVFDMGAASLAAYDYPINAIGDNYGVRQMDEIIHGSRQRLGMRIIPADKVRTGVFRALKRGEILAMLIDVPAPDVTIEVEFFNAKAEVSSIPARLALRTGAWVVPALVYRGPRRDELVRPILDTESLRSFTASGDEERDVREMTYRIMASLEAMLREHPDQWFIFRRVWPHLARKPAA